MRILIWTPERIERSLARLACEVDERNRGTDDLVLFGIEPNGIVVAHALARHISRIAGREFQTIPLDVKSADAEKSQPEVTVTGKHVVLVDDVLYTGRTARSALDAISRLGSPASIQLVVLIDRGHRQMPLQPDYVGRRLQTKYRERVDVDVNRDLAVYLVE
ncbi:MAG: bifunctional pyr operon transcriptional regulator/uracil phosphoribosyltransferase PyrR [Bacteroidota bacterium]|nr:bifunctional pyr operon transcriptional regulator/uracil phosphoribosyltransferase PyrR [Bacteroidota bacterium]MDE2834741.1 bifunctional pyr operon transcriptional regulator/uracil phosphoribosyltransferase PyrR [Bacteroidota bacterium]MDE2956904.1 bifunctional pyr operon transcriptional regulator/uracil phosphoribosyltransferase PyrR [Bacteroidota bacterium]